MDEQLKPLGQEQVNKSVPRGSKRWLGLVLVLIIAGVLVWGGSKWYANYQQLNQSHQFIGKISEVRPDKNLMVVGTHVLDANADKSDYKNPQTLEILITPATKFINIAWDSKTFKNVRQAGSMADLTPGISVTVRTIANSIADATINAYEVDYTKIVKTYALNGTVVSANDSAIVFTTTIIEQTNTGGMPKVEQKTALIDGKTVFSKAGTSGTVVKLSDIKQGMAISVFYSSDPTYLDSLKADRIEVK